MRESGGTAAATNPAGRTSKNWLLALLVISICINYIDRANLSAAAEGLSQDLALDPKQMGILFSSFFFSYAFFQIPSGWLIDRLNVYWVYAIGYLVWSAATALTGLANGYNLIFGLRLLLGMAEACAYPSYSKIIAGTFPEASRGLPNALIDAGSKLGPWLGLLIGGNIVAHYGWRMMFLSIGGISLLWLIPWVLAIRGESGHFSSAAGDEESPSLGRIFRERSAWGTFIGLLCANYAWYFLLTWLPSYLQRERHFSQALMSNLGSLPFLAVALSSTTSGWLSDRFIKRGAPLTRVRKAFVVSGLTGAMALLPAAIVENQTAAIILIVVACTFFGMFSSNVWAVTQCLAGARASGKWTGIQNTFGNISGIVAPYLTGWIVKETHSFYWAFVLVAGALLLAAASYLFVVKDLNAIAWELEPGTVRKN